MMWMGWGRGEPMHLSRMLTDRGSASPWGTQSKGCPFEETLLD